MYMKKEQSNLTQYDAPLPFVQPSETFSREYTQVYSKNKTGNLLSYSVCRSSRGNS